MEHKRINYSPNLRGEMKLKPLLMNCQ